MERLIEEYIMKELDKESFLNDVNDVCFIDRESMNEAVRKGIKNLVESMKDKK